MPTDLALAAFAQEVNRPEESINLARAALAFALFEYPKLDIQASLNQLDKLAEGAKSAMASADQPALGLARFLFTDLGFTGDKANYNNPKNSFINQVLERRLGIPISLSLIYLEVASRLGIPAQGIGLPGHFIVRVGATAPAMYLDPFHSGALMTEEDCRTRLHQITNGTLPFSPAFLAPVGPRYILGRMLNNLKNHYANVRDLGRNASVIERLLVLNPTDTDEMRNLGILNGVLGNRRKAMRLLERYLELRPQGSDDIPIQGLMATLSDEASRWN